MTYDDAGRITSTTDAFSQTTSFAYDTLGQQISVTLPDPDGAGPLEALSTTTLYDELGRRVSHTDLHGLTCYGPNYGCILGRIVSVEICGSKSGC